MGEQVWEGGGICLEVIGKARMGTLASNRESLFGKGWAGVEGVSLDLQANNYCKYLFVHIN